MILIPEQLRLHVSSGLEDDALMQLLDAAEGLIVQRAGPPGSRTERFHVGGRILALARPVDSITSITETVGSTVTTLAADDYSIAPRRFLLYRERTGANPRWGWHGSVLVEYVPVDDDAIRIGVQIDLCKLALTYNPGLTAQAIGTWREEYSNNSVWNNEEELEAILCRLDTSTGMVVVGGGW